MAVKYPPVAPYANETNALGTPTRRWSGVYAKEIIADTIAGPAAEAIEAKATKTELARVEGLISWASAPGYYAASGTFTASGRTAIMSPSELWINIAGKGHKLKTGVSMSVNSEASWDTAATVWKPLTTYLADSYVVPTAGSQYAYHCTTTGISSTLTPTWPTTIGATYNDGSCVWECCLNPAYAANRAGRDFYIYAVYSDTLAPTFILSINSTIAHGTTDDTSRKVGGFHCLCVDAGTNISDNGNIHPLSGYVAGDIIPASVWDILHRPKSSPEGMAYHDGLDLWIDIYLSSWTGAFGTDSSSDTMQLVSAFNGVTADGTSAEKWHTLKFDQQFSRQKKRLLWRREFMAASIGSNQATAIKGAADVNTTGGHVDTANRRMISNIGLEDCCGFLDQWGSDVGSTGASGWGNDYDANDHYVKGDAYNAGAVRVLLGGRRGDSSHCGSRFASWGSGCLSLAAAVGARGASEPLGR